MSSGETETYERFILAKFDKTTISHEDCQDLTGACRQLYDLSLIYFHLISTTSDWRDIIRIGETSNANGWAHQLC
ncbi:hypothetical protein SCLCIDRAFT_1215932 [Scleroderma citrinum Foug A]|uniref:Uncharacterized protein n=1 Tax=Scleroderma citrinum Foug A TaxID=1036808 RepID=A0A0C2ZIM1_9AGAM|nr:hypothetical protein SCLCIDRAFT_1215932 [Scleroderma citrinum Foug A]